MPPAPALFMFNVTFIISEKGLAAQATSSAFYCPNLRHWSTENMHNISLDKRKYTSLYLLTGFCNYFPTHWRDLPGVRSAQTVMFLRKTILSLILVPGLSYYLSCLTGHTWAGIVSSQKIFLSPIHCYIGEKNNKYSSEHYIKSSNIKLQCYG